MRNVFAPAAVLALTVLLLSGCASQHAIQENSTSPQSVPDAVSPAAGKALVYEGGDGSSSPLWRAVKGAFLPFHTAHPGSQY